MPLGALLLTTLAAVPSAEAARTVDIRIITSEVSRQLPAHPRRLEAIGGVQLSTPNRDRLGRYRGSYLFNLSDLQCSVTEVKDRMVLKFSPTDKIVIKASGAAVSKDDCEGVKFRRVLSWRIVRGTGDYEGASGNGIAVGTMRTVPGEPFLTSRMVYRGTLTR